MAQRIDGPFDFSDNNFAQYADGATWILAKGGDYNVTSKTLVTNARKWARSQGLEPEHKYLDTNPESVALRFTKSNVTAISDVLPRPTDGRAAMLKQFEAMLVDNPDKAKLLLNSWIREFKKVAAK